MCYIIPHKGRPTFLQIDTAAHACITMHHLAALSNDFLP